MHKVRGQVRIKSGLRRYPWSAYQAGSAATDAPGSDWPRGSLIGHLTREHFTPFVKNNVQGDHRSYIWLNYHTTQTKSFFASIRFPRNFNVGYNFFHLFIDKFTWFWVLKNVYTLTIYHKILKFCFFRMKNGTYVYIPVFTIVFAMRW